MIDPIVAGPEISVLHIAHEVPREDRVAIPKSIGHVDSAAVALLLGTRELNVTLPMSRSDDGPVNVDSEYQIRREARRDAQNSLGRWCQ